MENGETGQANSTEKIIEISPKKIGIVILLIFVIIIVVYFLEKNKGGKMPDANIEGNTPPVALFEPTKPCYAYLPCQFDASESYDPDGEIMYYEWEGLGSSSGAKGSPTIKSVFSASNYKVKLKVTDNHGFVSTLEKAIVVQPSYNLQIPLVSTTEEQISLIKSLCKSLPKLTNYKNYYNGYINDFHAHLIPGEEPYNYTIALLTAMNEFGVKRTALRQYGAGIEGDRSYEREKEKVVAEIAALCPERFDPFLAAVYPDDPDSVAYAKKNLEEYPWKGIGEVYIKNQLHGGFYTKEIQNLANTTTLMSIYKIAEQKKIPVHFHYEANTTKDIEAIEQALKENPSAIFVWAHSCGSPNDNSLTYEYLANKYKNLYCEQEFFSGFEILVDPSEINNKILVGSDSSVFQSVTPDVQTYQFVVDNTRYILSTYKYTEGQADQIAHGNYEEIIK